MKNHQVKYLAISLIAVFMFCTNVNDHRYTINENEQGVTTIVNSGGAKYLDPIFNLKEILQIGGETTTPMLYQPNSVHVGNDGSLYFIDEKRLKKFDAKGQFLSYISKEGQGPGEVLFPGLYHIFNDTLYVKQDQGAAEFLQAYHLFRPNGEFIKKITPYIPGKRLLPSGRNYFYQYLSQINSLYCSRVDEQTGDIYRGEYLFGLINQKTLENKPLKMDKIVVKPFFIVESKRGSMFFARPFILQHPYFVMRKNLYCLLPNGKEIYKFNSSGEITEKIILDLTQIPVTIHERDSIKTNNLKSRLSIKIKDRHIPTNKPIVCDMLISDDGYMWLKHGKEVDKYGQKSITYRLLDQKGEYLCDQIMPLEISEISNGNVYGFAYDKDGMKILKV